jgi:hypothetical protein
MHARDDGLRYRVGIQHQRGVQQAPLRSFLQTRWLPGRTRRMRRTPLPSDGRTMKAIIAGLVFALASIPINSHAQCGPGSTLASIEIQRVSEFAACGGGGLTATVVLAAVREHLHGPRLGRTFLGVIECPSINLNPGQRMLACIGESEPSPRYFVFDDFSSDSRPRRLVRYLGRGAEPRTGAVHRRSRSGVPSPKRSCVCPPSTKPTRIGGSPKHHRFDDFPLDTSPRRYAQTLASTWFGQLARPPR